MPNLCHGIGYCVQSQFLNIIHINLYSPTSCSKSNKKNLKYSRSEMSISVNTIM